MFFDTERSVVTRVLTNDLSNDWMIFPHEIIKLNYWLRNFGNTTNGRKLQFTMTSKKRKIRSYYVVKWEKNGRPQCYQSFPFKIVILSQNHLFFCFYQYDQSWLFKNQDWQHFFVLTVAEKLRKARNSKHPIRSLDEMVFRCRLNVSAGEPAIKKRNRPCARLARNLWIPERVEGISLLR